MGMGESISIDRSKALLLYGLEDPNDAMTRDASNGPEEESSWVGRSLWL